MPVFEDCVLNKKFDSLEKFSIVHLDVTKLTQTAKYDEKSCYLQQLEALKSFGEKKSWNQLATTMSEDKKQEFLKTGCLKGGSLSNPTLPKR